MRRVSTVLLPFDEGTMCATCGAIWRHWADAAQCSHKPGAGRTVPPAGEFWRRVRIRLGINVTYALLAGSVGMTAVFALILITG